VNVHKTIADFQSAVFISNSAWNYVGYEDAVVPKEKTIDSGFMAFVDKPFDMLMTDATSDGES